MIAPRQIIQTASDRPFRLVNGEVVNLIPLFRYLELPFDGDDSARPLNDWVFISGKILQAKAGDGMLVESDKTGNTVYILNFPLQRVDGDSFVAFVRANGTHSYPSVSGSLKTVRSYDHGTLIAGKDAAKLVDEVLADDQRKAEAAKQLAEEQQRELAKQKAERQAKLDAAVKKFREEQAAKGEAAK